MDRILKVLGEKTVHVSQLETENASLRAEIEALRSCAVEQERTSNSIRNNTPSGEHERLATKYENLSKLHRDLKEQHNKCASLIALEHKKYLEAKTICRQWKAYHDYKTLQRQTRAQQLAEAEQPGPITPRSLPSDPPDLPDDKHARISDLDDTPKALPGARQLSNEVHKPENSRQLHHLASEHPANEERTSSKTLRVSSSQSTDAGSDPMHGLSSPTGHREPSSDNEPVVIFTRPLKRKRSASALTMPPPVRIKQEENSPERPIEIKSEDFSSPVHNLRALGPPVREEGTVIKEERVQPVSAPKPQKDEPLRLRPLSALSLEDFKVNTKSTGAEHAFSETVRGRARRCLPGCTNPSCCGGVFLKAVQMGGYHGANDTNAEVLEKHFGENWAAIIAAYPPDKREKLLLEARASAFANQYGKHRQAFARRSTPPGFWRTDMPTTQQVEEDRAEAQAMVRQKVEERYREAMRDGGRWMFRDE
ncbi:hypothetical protein B0A55_09167 [Friedmanniomyces simplex]|uniref:DNA endonuclease activator Ctp1 C-terminal domain-containing protein n=1 Tax=Friedmanniomyces simplex TaxID=329884 RepID=A0A4U0WSK2_9PEZI|nr:hypothetical protein B0A55_09167 [Friedmanniomyces simplex]